MRVCNSCTAILESNRASLREMTLATRDDFCESLPEKNVHRFFAFLLIQSASKCVRVSLTQEAALARLAKGPTRATDHTIHTSG